jgi:hypothetical protein
MGSSSEDAPGSAFHVGACLSTHGVSQLIEIQSRVVPYKVDEGASSLLLSFLSRFFRRVSVADRFWSVAILSSQSTTRGAKSHRSGAGVSRRTTTTETPHAKASLCYTSCAAHAHPRRRLSFYFSRATNIANVLLRSCIFVDTPEKRTEKNLVCLRSLFDEIFVWANGEQWREKWARSFEELRLRSCADCSPYKNLLKRSSSNQNFLGTLSR